jgi:hypothetical protein
VLTISRDTNTKTKHLLPSLMGITPVKYPQVRERKQKRF